MRSSGSFLYLVFIAYMGSIGLAFAASHAFLVLGYGEMLVLGICLLSGPMLMLFHLWGVSERLVVAVLHIALAILLHPQVTLKEPMYLDTATQFELLRKVNSRNESWWVKADLGYELARSLKSNVTLELRVSSPILYWGFPPSVALTFWGVVLFFRLPKNGKEI